MAKTQRRFALSTSPPNCRPWCCSMFESAGGMKEIMVPPMIVVLFLPFVHFRFFPYTKYICTFISAWSLIFMSNHAEDASATRDRFRRRVEFHNCVGFICSGHSSERILHATRPVVPRGQRTGRLVIHRGGGVVYLDTSRRIRWKVLYHPINTFTRNFVLHFYRRARGACLRVPVSTTEPAGGSGCGAGAQPGKPRSPPAHLSSRGMVGWRWSASRTSAYASAPVGLTLPRWFAPVLATPSRWYKWPGFGSKMEVDKLS